MDYSFALEVHGGTPPVQGPFDSLSEALAAVDKYVAPGGTYSISEFPRGGNRVVTGRVVREGKRPA
jgi:hypothetical protein